MIDATRIHHTKEAYHENVLILLRQGHRVQSDDGKRAVLYKEPGYGHPLLHIAALFLSPIIGNIIVAWLARQGMGRSIAIEYRPPITGDTTYGKSKENPT